MIRLDQVNKSYGHEKVLRDLSLNIKRGEIYGLVGRNGAGKTTIFKIILGLTDFQSGHLSIDGGRNENENRKKRKDIGFFIGKNFFDYMTGRENLNYYRKLKGIGDKKEVGRVLSLVGLEDTSLKYKDYSMGMKQRLGIANALLGNPEILILDEPTNGLDPQGIKDMRNLIKKLNKEGMTIIVSSHILGELEHTANRFGIVDKGSIVREISYKDLENQEDYVKIKLGDLAKARGVLSSAGIDFIEEPASSKSLEEYYFDIIGEKND